SVYIERNSAASRFGSGDSWTILTPIEQSIKKKIEATGVPLKKWNVHINYGIKTGFNEAFIIGRAKRDELIAADPKSAEIIRPILRGRDIKRYSYEFADLWLIATFPSLKYDIEQYPAVKEYLLSFGMERLEQTGETHVVDGKTITARKKTNNKWFETQDSISYWNDFSKQKIVWGEISDVPKFSLDQNGEFVMEATTFMMTGESLEFLLCFLNSRLSKYYFSKIGTTTGVGTVRWKKYKIETFPIPKLSYDEQVPFTAMLNKILYHRQESLDSTTLEKDLDKMIYRLFKFSEEEIEAIEA
ncbi:MAG: TaqI-like C-terminal specificity domain-containing protein, partial [Dehalococcoides mccartyi]|uniref:TaqI-like C-terminal specificity domain-containing protein n=1 Tax=Dehalococcoides mccartyi TaxID=61435 RepID=UPI0030F5B713